MNTEELRSERIKLINKIEWGLFINEYDALKAQERLNTLNELIENKKG